MSKPIHGLVSLFLLLTLARLISPRLNKNTGHPCVLPHQPTVHVTTSVLEATAPWENPLTLHSSSPVLFPLNLFVEIYFGPRAYNPAFKSHEVCESCFFFLKQVQHPERISTRDTAREAFDTDMAHESGEVIFVVELVLHFFHPSGATCSDGDATQR